MPRPRVTEQRRQQIVDAAITVMGRDGFAAASIDEITREAGISRGLVSYHFRDKAELLSAVLARCQDAFREAVRDVAAQAADPAESVRLATRRTLQQAYENPDLWRIFFYFTVAGFTDPVIHDQIRDATVDFRNEVAAAIRDGQARGVFKKDIDPEAGAARIVGAIAGLALHQLIDSGGFPYVHASRTAEDMIMASLLVPA